MGGRAQGHWHPPLPLGVVRVQRRAQGHPVLRPRTRSSGGGGGAHLRPAELQYLDFSRAFLHSPETELVLTENPEEFGPPGT
eukprot:10890918-Alexandrium_andersonii.AAC.1